MVRLPDVVRAPPEKVWSAILDPATRTVDPRVATEARTEGDRFHYTRKGGSWEEGILEQEANRWLVLERRENGAATARLEWSLQPIDLGTLVVLAVKGTSFKENVRQSVALRAAYRRTIRAIKKVTEVPPPSRLDVAPAEGAPTPSSEAEPASMPEAPAEAPTPVEPTAKRAPRRTKK